MAGRVQYEVVKKLGETLRTESNLCVMYSDRGFQRLCVTKRLQKPLAQDLEARKALKREADICRKIQHSNIVNLLDFDQINGVDSLIHEFVFGTSVRRIFEICKRLKMQMSVAMAAHIGVETTRALHYLHTHVDPESARPQTIVHGAINPDNILVSYSGEIKIMDFSAAAFTHEPVTQLAPEKDQVRYQSPEFLLASKADRRQDIYSVGALLWELLSGAKLFNGGSVEEIARLKLEGAQSKRLSKLNDSVDEDLESILKRCLQYDAVKRFSSARELETALSSYFHKRDPDFTPLKLGAFLQNVMAKEHGELRELMKSALSRKNEMPIQSSDTQPPQPFKIYFTEPPISAEFKREIEHEVKQSRERGKRQADYEFIETNPKRPPLLDDDAPMKYAHFSSKNPNIFKYFFYLACAFSAAVLIISVAKSQCSKSNRIKKKIETLKAP